MIFGYARVSRDKQNYEMQIDELERYGCDKIYREKESGKKVEREQLDICLEQLRAGDVLIVWKIDRLGRTVKQLIDLADDFSNKNIELISLTETFDITSANGKLMFHILTFLAEMERSVLAERTKAGLKAARARGRVGGRPKVDEAAARTALTMYKSGEHTISEIVKITGISQGTLYNRVKIEGVIQ